jgi:hypothetical protein
LGEVGHAFARGDFNPLEDVNEEGNSIKSETINNGLVRHVFLLKLKF